jgi:hypothetical protein
MIFVHSVSKNSAITNRAKSTLLATTWMEVLKHCLILINAQIRIMIGDAIRIYRSITGRGNGATMSQQYLVLSHATMGVIRRMMIAAARCNNLVKRPIPVRTMAIDLERDRLVIAVALEACKYHRTTMFGGGRILDNVNTLTETSGCYRFHLMEEVTRHPLMGKYTIL